jgi:ankyrin repeat protein
MNDGERARQHQLWCAAVQGLEFPADCTVRGIPTVTFAQKLVRALVWNNCAQTLADFFHGPAASARMHPDDAALLANATCNGSKWVRLAARYGSDAVLAVLLLITPAAAVNEAGARGVTAIAHAVRQGQTRAAELLLAARANVNQQDNTGWSMLASAAGRDNAAMLHVLICAKADVHQACRSGALPVACAAYGKCESAVQVLLAAKACLPAVDRVAAAVYRRDWGEARRLIRAKAAVNDVDCFGNNNLVRVASFGPPRLAQLLVGAKAAVDGTLLTDVPLERAAYLGRAVMAQCLIDSKAQVNRRGEGYYDRGPVCAAAAEGHVDVVRMLIAAKADLERAEEYGFTPMTRAAFRGHCDVLSALMAAKVHVDAADDDHGTPLRVAAAAGHVDIVRLLLGAKADARATHDVLDETPLQLAERNGHAVVVQMLRAHLGTE